MLKRFLLKVFLSFLFILIGIQTLSAEVFKDSLISHSQGIKESKIVEKKSWNILPLPVVSYNTDLGVQLGGICNAIDFGDGKLYPGYYHKIFFVGSYYTKKSGIFRLSYDSDYLIPGFGIYGEIDYLVEKNYPFYGFNGHINPFDASKEEGFYRMERNMFKLDLYVKKEIFSNLDWVFGTNFFHITIPENKSGDTLSLRGLYLEKALIDHQESKGGNVLQLQMGLIFDNRDFRSDPNRGIYADISLIGGGELSSLNKYSYLRLGAMFTQVVPLYKDRLNLAYKIAYQGNLIGNMPYYMLAQLNVFYQSQNTSEGLGGLSTLRGVLRNRIIGNGIAWLNFELRYRFAYFKLFNQNFYLVLNPFFDMGMLVQSYRQNKISSSEYAYIHQGEKTKLHMTAGLGGKVVVNRNFVFSVEAGVPFRSQDGRFGMQLGLNYIF